MLGDAAQLLVDFIDVGPGALIEEGVIHVVGVIHALVFHLGPAHVGAVVAAAGHHGADGAVGADHVDLLGRGALRHEDLTADAGPGAVGGHGVAGVAAAVLHHPVHADGSAVGDQGRSAPVLEGQGGHEVVHLQQHVAVQPYHGCHALAQGDVAPGLVLQGHELPVAEQAPLAPVYHAQIKPRRLEIQLPQATAMASGGAGGDVGGFAALGTDVFHEATPFP